MERNLKKKILYGVLISTILLTGCKNKNDYKETVENYSESITAQDETKYTSTIEETNVYNIIEETETSTEPTLENVEPTTEEETTSIQEETIETENETISVQEETLETENETINVGEEIKLGFQSNINEIKELINSDQAERAKELGKDVVASLIDFLFYGDDINGVTINDCSDIVKQDLYDYLKDMDTVLSFIDSDYKEQIGERYNIIKDYTSMGYDTAITFIIEKVGTEKYNDIITKKDELWGKAKDNASKYTGKLLEYLDDRYQDWKNND